MVRNPHFHEKANQSRIWNGGPMRPLQASCCGKSAIHKSLQQIVECESNEIHSPKGTLLSKQDSRELVSNVTDRDDLHVERHDAQIIYTDDGGQPRCSV
jgi:hypothetical protein